MKLFESIWTILEQRGASTISSICEVINQNCQSDCVEPILPSHLKTIISQKKDIFLIEEDIVNINPNKLPISLTAYVGGIKGPSYQVKVSFDKKRFIFSEWRTEDYVSKGSIKPMKKVAGDIHVFRREIYELNLWNWKKSYQMAKGIVLDGKSWNIKLVTKDTIYMSEGLQGFPPNWSKFCHAIERLTGSTFR